MTGGLRSLVDALVYGLAQVSSLKRESMNTHEVSAVTFKYQKLLDALCCMTKAIVGQAVSNKPLELSAQL